MTRKTFDAVNDAMLAAIAQTNEMSPALEIHGGSREELLGMLNRRIVQNLDKICPELLTLMGGSFDRKKVADFARLFNETDKPVKLK